MTGKPPSSPKDAAREARDKRLAEALRANLRRRKAADRPKPPAIPANETPSRRP
jgi:hypothetical protein